MKFYKGQEWTRAETAALIRLWRAGEKTIVVATVLREQFRRRFTEGMVSNKVRRMEIKHG